MRSTACLVLLICVCSWNVSSSYPLGDNPAISTASRQPSPTTDTLSHMVNAFEGGLTIDKVINLFKTFRMGSKFFKIFLENIPVANKYFTALAERNVEIRLLTNYWLDGKFPDLREIFEVVTSHSSVAKDAVATYISEPQLTELRQLVLHGNITDSATLDRILQLYFGRKFDIVSHHLIARESTSLMNVIYVFKFVEQIKAELFFKPMFLNDYITVLQYLFSLDYSPLLKIQALPESLGDGKYSVVHGPTGTDPGVLTLMGDIHSKYEPLLKARATSSQVEEAVYAILDQVMDILKRATTDVKTVFAINGTTPITSR